MYKVIVHDGALSKPHRAQSHMKRDQLKNKKSCAVEYSLIPTLASLRPPGIPGTSALSLQRKLDQGSYLLLFIVARLKHDTGVGEEPPALPLGPPFGREQDDERGGGRALRAASPRQRINPRPEQQRALSAWLEERKEAGKRAYPTLPRTNNKAKRRGNTEGRARKRRERKRDAKSRCHAASLSDPAPPAALPYPTTNPSRSCLASGLSRKSPSPTDAFDHTTSYSGKIYKLNN
ncbi:hypothetical protein C8F04DRAFT_1177630 [Mycena alexandri]|uniref:Uncharacterized protein n=1 Tax=Mycena alexandri TaxID=1745969 RepID=A0AAD6T8E7_9AGAR|nr:hypothetical protein C8F04DRAFT_1177630 [Mycena alexandri]